MNDATILLCKSYKDYEANVKLFLGCEEKNDMYTINIALYLMQHAIEKCLESYLIKLNIVFKRKSGITYLLTKLICNLDIIPSIYCYSAEIDLWETSARYNLYELEDINLYYAVVMDYCKLYNFVAYSVFSND